MRNSSTKISLIFVTLLLTACNAVKRVPSDQYLLTKNTITREGEEVTNASVYNFLYQTPNTRVLGLPFRLYIYNWARPNLDSIMEAQRIAHSGKKTFWNRLLSEKQVQAFRDFKVDVNQGIKNLGEEPAIVSEALSKKSADRLENYYANNGFFNVDVNYAIDKDSTQRAEVTYTVDAGKPYYIDSITKRIPSRVADSIYDVYKAESTIVDGARYRTLNVNAERSRLVNLYRNQGLFHFEADRISFLVDSVDTDHKAHIEVVVDNRKLTLNDSVLDLPYKVHKISEINVVTDANFANRNDVFQDSIKTDEIQFYAFDEINYRTEALADVIPLKIGDIYSDLGRSQTLSQLSGLRTFKYPSIQYLSDPNDTTGVDLIANIRLTPLEKYKLRAGFEVSTSNIQDIGIGGFGSLLIRNLFRGAETLEISGRGSIGASDDLAIEGDNFFNITEIGGDAKLTFPRIFFPLNTDQLIPAEWRPTTNFNVGISTQQNIGLDKQNISSKLSYNWYPRPTRTYKLDLIDLQYVRNLNPSNYYNIYSNSFDDLNAIAVSNFTDVNPNYFTFPENGGQPSLSIPSGANSFIRDVQNNSIGMLTANERRTINAIKERQDRLTEDNLILATNMSFIYSNRDGLLDNTFTRFRMRLELAGNILSLASSALNTSLDESGNEQIFGVTYSQYIKPEIEYVKHWDLGNDNVFAGRLFGGIAIPYGNSNSIPFARSFFAGGSNDNRAWQAYQLGPGSSGAPDEFNEANLKLALNLEHRFTILGAFKGALFADIGNIWHVFDNVDQEDQVFQGLASLKDTAIGTGAGLRYDFDFFVVRLDVGFKTYNPALDEGSRWFKQYNFANATYNIGINYPF